MPLLPGLNDAAPMTLATMLQQWQHGWERSLSLDETLSDDERAVRAAAKFYKYFPDCTTGCKHPKSTNPKNHAAFCRALYRKHLAFFAAGSAFRERLFLKANRVGGTDAAAYEVTCHLTGEYPPWWTGRRFVHAGEWWVCGRTRETTRDIVQLALMGPSSAMRTGMLPPHRIKHWNSKGGIPNGLDTIWVEHVSGQTASAQFRSFDQGRTAFEGTAKQGVWLDEECDMEVASECLLRTMTTDGMLLYTFTPLQGLTAFVESFLDQAVMDSDGGGYGQAKENFWAGKDADA